MNKRRRYKAKARRADVAFWRRAARPATFAFWRSRVERGLPPLTEGDRQRAMQSLRVAIRDVYARCTSSPSPD